jgi:hypothetical protein
MAPGAGARAAGPALADGRTAGLLRALEAPGSGHHIQQTPRRTHQVPRGEDRGLSVRSAESDRVVAHPPPPPLLDLQ